MSYPEKLISRTVVPMFRAPDPLSEQVSQALLAQRVREAGGRDAWRLIQTADGYQGWVAAVALVDIPPDWGLPWVEVLDLWANLRARGDYKLAAVTQATIGTRLPLLERSEGWVRVLVPDGQHLWTEERRVHEVGALPVRRATPQQLRRTARRFLGIPYLWGGCSPVGLDCSGFVQLVLRLHDVELMRDAHQQAVQGDPVDAPGMGDLAFFGPEERPGAVTHVGMMLDNQRFIHAAGGDRVRINRLSDAPYCRMFRCARRFLERG